MTKQPSTTEQFKEIEQAFASSCDVRETVRKTRELIESSRDAMRESDARIERAYSPGTVLALQSERPKQ